MLRYRPNPPSNLDRVDRKLWKTKRRGTKHYLTSDAGLTLHVALIDPAAYVKKTPNELDGASSDRRTELRKPLNRLKAVSENRMTCGDLHLTKSGSVVRPQRRKAGQ